MDVDKFFDAIRQRPFGGSLTQSQVEGIDAILAAFDKFQSIVPDRRFKAYMFATAFWETARTMQPISEIGHGIGHEYGEPVGPYDQCYYGRGLIQLTWLANYQKAQEKLSAVGVICDLVKEPNAALGLDIAAPIMILGMTQGWFTGKRLSDYFDDAFTDWTGARRIINAQDHAQEIAAIAVEFSNALALSA